VPFRAASQARLRRELKSVEIITVPGSHATFMLASRDTIARAFRSFLAAEK
jgi:hypothetical protein